MDGIRAAARYLSDNGHNVSVGMLDGVIAHFTILCNGFPQIGHNKFLKSLRTEKRVHIKAVIRTQSEAVQQMPRFVQLPCKFQRLLHPAGRLLVENLRLLVHTHGKIHHPFPVRNGPGRIAVGHNIVLVSALFPDPLQQPPGILQSARIWMDKNRAVPVRPGRIHIKLCHFIHMKTFFRH